MFTVHVHVHREHVCQSVVQNQQQADSGTYHTQQHTSTFEIQWDWNLPIYEEDSGGYVTWCLSGKHWREMLQKYISLAPIIVENSFNWSNTEINVMPKAVNHDFCKFLNKKKTEARRPMIKCGGDWLILKKVWYQIKLMESVPRRHGSHEIATLPSHRLVSDDAKPPEAAC